jgi:HlyD family secretion protein
MTRQRLLVLGLLLAAAAIIAVLLVPRLGGARTLSGYVEGEALYLAAPVSGRVVQMAVARGDEVAAGQRLFTVDPSQLAAQRDQAGAEVAAAQAQVEDARKGMRSVELAVYEANIAAAEARAREARATLRRVEVLARKGFYAQARLDDARATAQTAQAQVTAARRQRDAATLGSREDQVRAAEARVSEAQAGLSGASSRLADLSPVAPSASRVEDVFYQQGEWAGANQPVLALLPYDRVKVRFYVPEQALSAYRPGGVVRFSCDGCARGMTARIVFVSPRPEFTPPVIYSRESRDRLVYLVEARPSVRLNPGQPVDVVPLEPVR